MSMANYLQNRRVSCIISADTDKNPQNTVPAAGISRLQKPEILKMDMGDKIYNLRVQKGLTLEQLGNLAGVGKSTVRKWENGMIANMRRDKILKVSEALGTTPSYLMGWDEKRSSDSAPATNPSTPSRFHTVLTDRYEKENILNCSNVSETYIKADFCLTVPDDSMSNARILKGDLVFAIRQAAVNNGELAVLSVNNSTLAVLKRFYYYKEQDVVILKADAPAFEDLFFQHEEIGKIEILGKAVGFQSIIRQNMSGTSFP